MGKNNDAETRVHPSLLEVGRFRCGSEGCGSSPVSRLKLEQAGSLFVCCFQNPKFLPVLFLTLLFSFLPFTFYRCTLSSPAAFKLFISLNKHWLEQIQRGFNKNNAFFSGLRGFKRDVEPQDELCRGWVKRGHWCSTLVSHCFKMKGDGLGLEEEISKKQKRNEKRKQNLTKYGQDAEQDGDEGMDAHSHPQRAGSTLRGNPSGITPTQLQVKIMDSLLLVWTFRSVWCAWSQPLSSSPYILWNMLQQHRPWLPVWWCWSEWADLHRWCARPRCNPWGHASWTSPFSWWWLPYCLRRSKKKPQTHCSQSKITTLKTLKLYFLHNQYKFIWLFTCLMD